MSARVYISRKSQVHTPGLNTHTHTHTPPPSGSSKHRGKQTDFKTNTDKESIRRHSQVHAQGVKTHTHTHTGICIRFGFAGSILAGGVCVCVCRHAIGNNGKRRKYVTLLKRSLVCIRESVSSWDN